MVSFNTGILMIRITSYLGLAGMILHALGSGAALVKQKWLVSALILVSGLAYFPIFYSFRNIVKDITEDKNYKQIIQAIGDKQLNSSVAAIATPIVALASVIASVMGVFLVMKKSMLWGNIALWTPTMVVLIVLLIAKMTEKSRMAAMWGVRGAKK